MGVLTGVAKEHALIGNEVSEKFFKEANLSETLAALNDVETGARFLKFVLGRDAQIEEVLNKLERTLHILRFIQQRKKDCSTANAVEILKYSQSYAANVKKWPTT